MGVDIATYRVRIGSFNHRNGPDISLCKLSTNFDILEAIGALSFIGILLIISGIEQNPGPNNADFLVLCTSLLALIVAICTSYLQGFNISWTFYISLPFLTSACYLILNPRLWNTFSRSEEHEEAQERTQHTYATTDALFKDDNTDKKTLELLQKLNLLEKYPGKIHMRDFITIRLDEQGSKRSTLKDLPYIFLNKIASMNCDAMNLRDKFPDTNSTIKLNSVTDLYEGCSGNKVEEGMCPLDLLILVFQCCDPMVKQIVFEKLFLCKLAVPFLYPDVHCQSLMSIWPIRSTLIGIEQSGELFEEPILDIEVKMVTFARFGRPPISKSNFLNYFLRSDDTFLHRDSACGLHTRYLTQGYVEMFLLPSMGDNRFKFDQSIIFFNMRGDLKSYDEKIKLFISKISDTITIFTDIYSIIENSQDLQNTIINFPNVLLIISSNLDENDKNAQDSLSKLVENIRNNSRTKLQIICTYKNKTEKGTAEFANEIYENVSNELKGNAKLKSLSSRLTTASKYAPSSDEDDEAKEAALSVMNVIKQESTGHETLSKVITPVQMMSTDIGELLKELYKCNKELNQVEEIKKEIKKIRKGQLCKISEAVSMFIEKMQTYESNKSSLHYYLCWLKYFLEQDKRKVLPKLMKENQAAWYKYRKMKKEENITSYQLNECEKSIKEIEGKIEEASFGLDHLFREVGHICDTIITLRPNRTVETQLPSVKILSKIVATLVCDGFAFELIDGNIFYMPIKWVKLVLGEVNNVIGAKRVMTFSVLGVQSSGKSTLLNTMFGLQLPTSAGRCTKGIHAYLLPILQAESKPFEYVLMLDTEGLRAPGLSERNYLRDNKLSTIITGLGDVNLINIMGENHSEMKDVLQIIVHALLRIQATNKKLRMVKSCAFIHQNITDITASDKMKTSIQLLVRSLDIATKESAESELNSEIKTFNQVIEFDVEESVWYLPSLWLGNPPMARVNNKYSENVQKIREKLFQQALYSQKKSYKTLNEIVALTEDLWKGVLTENFVI